MLDAKKLCDTATWRTDLDTLMARISDHYTADALTVGSQHYLLRYGHQ